MAHQQPTPGAVAAIWHWVDRRIKTGDVFILAALITLAPLFLTNNYQSAPRLLSLVFFPVVALHWMVFRISWRRWPALDVSARFIFTFSVILVAAFVYLLTINLSDWSQPGAVARVLDRQWRYAGQILVFMACFAYAVRAWPEFLPRFVAALSTLVAVSALHNMIAYVPGIVVTSDMSSWRLVNTLGMPGYTNSTNISVIYALLFVASAAVIVNSRLPSLLRYWLIPVALILLGGVMLTQSRSAYIGIIVGLMLVLWLAPHAFRRAALLSFIAGIALGVMVLLALPQTRTVLAERGASYRPEIWSIYAGQAQQKPLLGYGGMSNIDIKLGDGTMIDQPHNLVLSAQIRGGIFCALAMITMLLGSLYWSMRFLRLRGEVIPLAMIATVATAGLFDYNLLITPITWPWVTFWLPFGICAGAEIVVRQCSQPPA
ncbi:MAG: O-antigen ligase family protein [Pseudomonadota bacterium]